MREVICPTTIVSNTAKISDQFSIDENTNEVVLTFNYTKGDEAGITITIERNDIAEETSWATISDLTAVGTNPLLPYTLQMTATGIRSYSLKSIPFGFYRVRYAAQDIVVINGTLAIYIVKDK